MNGVPELQAEPLPGGDRIAVQWFDRRHERVRLGPHRHRDLELMYFQRGGGTHRLGTRTYDTRRRRRAAGEGGFGARRHVARQSRTLVARVRPTRRGAHTRCRTGSRFVVAPGAFVGANPLLATVLRVEQHPATARFTIPDEQRPAWAAHLRIMCAEPLSTTCPPPTSRAPWAERGLPDHAGASAHRADCRGVDHRTSDGRRSRPARLHQLVRRTGGGRGRVRRSRLLQPPVPPDPRVTTQRLAHRSPSIVLVRGSSRGRTGE
jgi:hypothetical protein